MRRRALQLWLRAVQLFDRARLRCRVALSPGLEIDPRASTNLACARYRLAPGARLRIGPGVETERRPGALHFLLGPGARVEVGEGTWLRTELDPIHLVADEGAHLGIGPDCLLNGCHLSAKRELTLGRRVWVGPGTRVFDADQHELDHERPERIEPVAIRDHSWIAADCTVLRGVEIGPHSVVGARSLVTRSIPAHSLAFGCPAEPRGPVGDRSRAR